MNEANEASTRSQVIFYDDLTINQPELWGPHLTETTTDDFVDQYNMVHYLCNYWARVQKVQTSSLPVLKKSIYIGKRLNMNNITYDCKLPLGTEKHGTFVKLKLPVDKNAYGGLASEEDSEPKTFFWGSASFFWT